MTKKDKELLLKDLCARLPYGVICECYHTEFDEWTGEPFVAKYNDALETIDVNEVFLAGGFSYGIDELKPYLRPMSSMTDGEINEYENYITNEKNDQLRFCNELVFYNSHHLDYRGLIEKGLALEAPEGMYNS